MVDETQVESVDESTTVDVTLPLMQKAHASVGSQTFIRAIARFGHLDGFFTHSDTLSEGTGFTETPYEMDAGLNRGRRYAKPERFIA